MTDADGVGQSAGLWRLAAALFTASFATFSLLYSVQPLLPDFARDFRLSAATSSLAHAAMQTLRRHEG